MTATVVVVLIVVWTVILLWFAFAASRAPRGCDRCGWLSDLDSDGLCRRCHPIPEPPLSPVDAPCVAVDGVHPSVEPSRAPEG